MTLVVLQNDLWLGLFLFGVALVWLIRPEYGWLGDLYLVLGGFFLLLGPLLVANAFQDDGRT